MSPIDKTQVDHLLSRSDKQEMIAPLSRLAVIDECFGIGGVWFAGGGEFHASEGFPHKAQLSLFKVSGEPLAQTQHTRGWFPSVCWHRRVFEGGKLVVRELKFIAKDTVYDVLELINHTTEPLDLKMVIRGRASAKGTASFKDGWIHIDEEEARTLSGTYMILASEPRLDSCMFSEQDVEATASFDCGPRELYGDRIRYLAAADLSIPADGREKAALAVAWDVSKRMALSQLPKDLRNADSLLPDLKEGWRKFWEESVPAISVPDEGLEKLYYYGWYVNRAQMMPPQGRLPHIYQAPTKFAHVGVWLQDHSYTAIGNRWLNNTGFSQNGLRLLMKNQFSNGMIPSSVNAFGVRVYDSKTGHALTVDVKDPGKRDPREIPTQLPPVFTIAANEVFMKTGDLHFLKECYQAALHLDDWMVRDREDEDGLFRAIHMMDIEHCAGSRRLEEHEFIKAVDVSALNVYHRRLLMQWASILRETRNMGVLEKRADRTARSIFKRCWDPERGFFYDILPDGSRSDVETAAGFYAVYAAGESLSPGSFAPLIDALQDRNRFWTPIPVPTISLASGEAGQGVSQSVDWFIINALVRLNRKDLAEMITKKLLKTHLPEGEPESREGFDARTGEGKGSPDFAWVALMNDLLITRILGIQPLRTGLRLEPWLFDSWEHASIHGLKLGPWTVDVKYLRGRNSTTIKIRTVTSDRRQVVLPVNIWWRTRPGERVEFMNPKGNSFASEDFASQKRDVAHVMLECPFDMETVVNIRTRKA